MPDDRVRRLAMYRALEVLCSWVDVGKPLDIWSVGCIFAEMIRRQATFLGVSAQIQLQLITACIGKPDKNVLRKMDIHPFFALPPIPVRIESVKIQDIGF